MEQTAQIPPAATPEAQPIETASQTAAQSLPRSASGRFTGQGAVALDAPAPVSDYLAVEEGTAQLERLVKQAIAELARPARARRGKRAKQRVWALAASPGASKSRTSQSEIAAQPRNKFRGDILWHALTLKLAEEGAEHVRQLGKPVQVMRGRSAPLFPGSTERMCRKWQLAERLGRMGYNITNSLCRRVDQSGEEHLCPHYARCAYWRNMRDLTAAPQIRFAATSYLPLGKDADRPVGLRIVDETLWAGLLWHSDLRMDTFLTRRQPLAKDQKSKQLALKVTKAARAVVDALKSERRDPMQLPSTKKDYQAFARFEEAHIDELPEIRPEISEADQLAIVELAESRSRDARRMARLWRLLAAAKKAGRKRVERVRLILDHRDSREVSARHVIRLLGCKEPPRDAPVLLLDADADPLITEAIFPGATISEIRLRPNAHVIQVHDRTMSKTALENPRQRERWRAVIRMEVLRDRLAAGGGVLVGASKRVVQWFFEDAGHSFDGMSADEISTFMLNTPLHGARWLWFGGRALGSNAWRDCTAVVVIGREELPLDVLEDQGRALFGDRTGDPLKFVEPDEHGIRQMPEKEVPYLMADGRALGVRVRMHPDKRIRALQRQSRECATRQLIERLRLAHAAKPKRVIIGCKIPIPDMAVNELVTWEELCPDERDAAIVKGLVETGFAPLSCAGLAEIAPEIFPTVAAAKSWEKRQKKAGKGGRSAIRNLLSGQPPFSAASCRIIEASLRREGQRGRATKCLVLRGPQACPNTIAEEVWGPLSLFSKTGDLDDARMADSPEQVIVSMPIGISPEVPDEKSLLSGPVVSRLSDRPSRFSAADRGASAVAAG